ncbi:uncharacterized protein LOC128218383 [Mya arenaria]|uniref:uncharacterized protein LOC128218383 n=1 Tax=Mya arenaria TaxID=6604 RepID=UPI0022DFC248|nr:uncharacterized protein LOC128218383 [Mya arenaria]
MDAVPGRIAPEPAGSSHDHTFCQPCAEDGKIILPEAFCPVCKEFLCSPCARVHRNMKLTKSHALQDKSTMPSSLYTESDDETFTETCQHHAKEFTKYKCTNHEALLCGECLADKTHRSCNIEKISQLAKRYREGTEYNSLKTGLAQMVNDISKLSHDIHTDMKTVNDESIANINELRKFRNEINLYLDKREKELLEEIEQTKEKSQSLLSELKLNCQDIQAATEKLKVELQAMEVNNNQLFISGTRAIKELFGLQSALKDIRERKVPYFKFNRDPATEQLLASCTAIGRVDQTESDFADHQKQSQGRALNQCRADLSQSQFSKLFDIPVKTAADPIKCGLTSVALLSGERLLLADFINSSVKLVDTTTNKMVSQVKLPGDPQDLCLLPGDRAAVALPNKKKIQFVSTRGNVTLQEVVNVDGRCYGIDFCDDNLIVSFSRPGKVVMIDIKGKVKKSVDKDSSGKPLFLYPEYLTVTRESQTPPVIYVTDMGTNTVTKLSISLEVLQTYKDPILKSPRGLTAVGDNQLLVCGWDSNTILLVDTLTGKITQLLGKEEGIENPQSVAYCSLRKMLFVTCWWFGRPDSDNIVKVFNLVQFKSAN